MTQIRFFSATLIFILSIVVFNTSCKKDDNENKVTLTPDKTSVKPYELVAFSVADVNLTKNEYSGKLGNVDVTAVKVEDNKLMILIPNLEANSYSFSLNIEDRVGTTELIIEVAETIADAEAVISPIKTQMKNSISYLETVASETGNILTIAETTLLNNMNAEFDKLYAQMSDNEKMQLAQFISVNSALFTHTVFGSTKANEQILAAYKTYLAGAIINIAWSGLSLGLMIAAPDPTFITKGIAIVAAGFLVVELLELGYRTIQLYGENVVEADAQIQSSLKSSFIFQNNTEFTFDVSVEYRTISNQDLGSSNETLNSIFKNLDTFQYWWGEVDGFIITMKQIFGFENGGLSNRPQAVSEITTYSSVNEIVEDASFASIGNITNQFVNVSSSSGQQLKATFSTEQPDDQTFSFSFTYEIDNLIFEKVYSATLIPAFPITLIANSINNSGQYSGCYNDPMIMYYLNFDYDDPFNLVNSDLSNIVLTQKFEDNGCIAPWRLEFAYGYFADYPVAVTSTSISVPFGFSLGDTNSDWAKAYVHFIDLNSGQRISNVIQFDVIRGVNYP